MTAEKGPVETALNSSAFQAFWTRVNDELRELQDNLLNEAMKAIREGNNVLALSFLTRATSVGDVTTRIQNSPTNMIKQEKGETHDRTSQSSEAGYTGIG